MATINREKLEKYIRGLDDDMMNPVRRALCFIDNCLDPGETFNYKEVKTAFENQCGMSTPEPKCYHGQNPCPFGCAIGASFPSGELEPVKHPEPKSECTCEGHDYKDCPVHTPFKSNILHPKSECEGTLTPYGQELKIATLEKKLADIKRIIDL